MLGKGSVNEEVGAQRQNLYRESYLSFGVGQTREEEREDKEENKGKVEHSGRQIGRRG